VTILKQYSAIQLDDWELQQQLDCLSICPSYWLCHDDLTP